MNINNPKVTSVTYWLNKLQNLTIEKNIFLTITLWKRYEKTQSFKKVSFTHPYYDLNTLEHQNLLKDIQIKTIFILWQLFWLWFS